MACPLLAAAASVHAWRPSVLAVLCCAVLATQPLRAVGQPLGDYVCVAPIMEGEALDESEVWSSMAAEIGGTPFFGEGTEAGFAGLSTQDQVILRLIDGRAAAECASGADIREPIGSAAEAAFGFAEGQAPAARQAALTGHRAIGRRLLGTEMPRVEVPSSAWEHQSAGDLVRRAVDEGRSRESDLEHALRPRSHRSDPPVAHSGEDCWQPCGNRSGLCTSGFCGGGVCCQRWHLDRGGECPIGVHGGCQDRHCCVARPDPPAATHDLPKCYAGPGKYCLMSLAKGLREKNLSSAEFCAIQRTQLVCPPGFFCTGGRTAPRACKKGRQCLGGSAQEDPCPAGVFCPISIWQAPCPEAHACPENSTVSSLCPPGSYCQGGISTACPKGHMCASGSIMPKPCARLADCPRGSSSQGWVTLAKCSWVVVIPLWTIGIKAVPLWLHPKGGLVGAIPPLVTLFVLGAAWAINLNLVYVVSSQLGWGGADPLHLSIERVFGFTPHATALVFVTICYLFLLYGIYVSVKIEDPAARVAFDSLMLGFSCVAFNLYLEDWHSTLFLFVLWLAVKVVWAMLSQHGSWAFRVGLLYGALAFLVVCFCFLGAPGLAWTLQAALLASSAKEVLQLSIPWSVLWAKLLGKGGELPEATPMTLAMAPPTLASRLRSAAACSTDAGPGRACAAAVIAAAQASLDEHRREQRRDASPDEEAKPSSSWVPRYGAGRGGDFDSEGEDEGGAQAGGSCSSRPPAQGISFELKDVCYRLECGRQLLQTLSFAVPAGASAAIMGASGAGKTTLLSVLSGRCGDGRLVGQLLINGTSFLPWQMAALRPLIGYVPQDDVMHRCLTVRENLEFQADLRLRHAIRAKSPEAVSEELKTRIDDTLAGLGLAHVQHRTVKSGLSGGQRKRVSIGMEIVTKPRVLLLDEPSSGLDASTSHRILEMVMHQASTEQCTTFATIHQPRWNTLRLFDMLILLAPGGHLVYAGSVAALKAYFMAVPHVDFPKSQNPADVIIDATTFESARAMAVQGIWKAPPQCLRAILIPTPEMEDEEAKEPWQMQEFGKMLAALWRSFTSAQPSFCAASGPKSAVGAAAAEEGPAPSSTASSSNEPPAARGARRLRTKPGDIELGMLDLTPRPPARARASERESNELLRPNSTSPRWTNLWLALWAPAAKKKPHDQRDVRLRHGAHAAAERLEQEAEDRIRDLHWALQVWTQMGRALLTTSRAVWPTIAMNSALLVLAVCAESQAFSSMGFEHIFKRNTLVLLLLCLVQTITSSRIFGGEESTIAGREAGVSSLPQVLYAFVGKDMASLVEIGLAAACFTLTYWPLVESNASGGDIFSIGFALTYCVWGVSHIWAVVCPSNVAFIMGVVMSFLWFVFDGVKPSVQVFANGLGGYGTLLLLMSPIRWALSSLVYRHVVGPGSTYLEPVAGAQVQGHFLESGFDMSKLPRRCPDHSAGVLQRWLDGNGWGCHSGQLFLLGILFRVLAAVCLLLRSASQASGGQLSFGSSSVLKTRLLRDALVTFLAFVLIFELHLLGLTL